MSLATCEARAPVATIAVSAFTSSRRDPSSRFRMRQFIAPLRARGIAVKEHCPLFSKYSPAWLQLTGLPALSRLPGILASHRRQISWLNRELLSGWPGCERLAGGVRLLDIDDALWVPFGERMVRRLVRCCHGIIAANETLAAHLRQWHDQVWVVPTCIDLSRFCPGPRRAAGRPWTIGWSGTAWNLPYLYEIAGVLASFLRTTPDTRLLVVCDRPPHLPELPDGRWRYLPWSEESEVDSLHLMDVGLMPLPDNEWTRGKSAFKLLSYLAAGLPVIASPVGVAAKILNHGRWGWAARSLGDWTGRLSQAWEERNVAIDPSAREFISGNYSLDLGTGLLTGIFRKVLSL
jgi:glycosyltransferase involved in cell wall biosynthesis